MYQSVILKQEAPKYTTFILLTFSFRTRANPTSTAALITSVVISKRPSITMQVSITTCRRGRRPSGKPLSGRDRAPIHLNRIKK